MRIFKTRLFAKWAKKEKLMDQSLRLAIQEMEKGLIEADLGGFVYKKRIPLEGRGKRGGARSIVIYRAHDKAFFIFGYAKNEKSDMSNEELKSAKMLSKDLISYSDSQLIHLIQQGKLIEVSNDE